MIGESWPPSLEAPAHLASSQQVSLWPREQAGPCPAGSRALTKAAHWLGPGLEAAAAVTPIPASATSWQQPSVRVTV